MLRATVLLSVTAGLVAVGPLSAAAATAPKAATGTVTVVHGLRGLVADISVDGKTVLRDFTAARVTNPLKLSAGRHTVTVKNQAASGPDATILTANLTVRAGGTETAAIGLTPAGAARLFVYPEPAIDFNGQQAALVVRHAAAVASVRVTVDGQQLGSQALVDGGSAQRIVTGGVHQVLVRSASGVPLLPAQALTLSAGKVTTMYLTGSAKLGTLGWVATVREPATEAVLQSVPAGDGSTIKNSSEGITATTVGLGVGVALLAGAGTAAIARRRPRYVSN